MLSGFLLPHNPCFPFTPWDFTSTAGFKRHFSTSFLNISSVPTQKPDFLFLPLTLSSCTFWPGNLVCSRIAVFLSFFVPEWECKCLPVWILLLLHWLPSGGRLASSTAGQSGFLSFSPKTCLSSSSSLNQFHHRQVVDSIFFSLGDSSHGLLHLTSIVSVLPMRQWLVVGYYSQHLNCLEPNDAHFYPLVQSCLCHLNGKRTLRAAVPQSSSLLMETHLKLSIFNLFKDQSVNNHSETPQWSSLVTEELAEKLAQLLPSVLAVPQSAPPAFQRGLLENVKPV